MINNQEKKTQTSRLLGDGSHAFNKTQPDKENKRLERIIMDAQCFYPTTDGFHKESLITKSLQFTSDVFIKRIWMSFSQGSSKAFEFFQIRCCGGVEDLLGIMP